MRKVKSERSVIARLIIEPLTEQEAVATGTVLRLPRSYRGRITLSIGHDGSISLGSVSINGEQYLLMPKPS